MEPKIPEGVSEEMLGKNYEGDNPKVPGRKNSSEIDKINEFFRDDPNIDKIYRDIQLRPIPGDRTVPRPIPSNPAQAKKIIDFMEPRILETLQRLEEKAHTKEGRYLFLTYHKVSGDWRSYLQGLHAEASKKIEGQS